MIIIPRSVCRQSDQALEREWLVTNGRGSYASSTITGARTRRYHGLLVAALDPPLGRTLLVAKVDEEVQVGGRTYRLGTNEYLNGVFDPDGFLFLNSASIDGMIPSLHFSGAAFSLTKTIWMEHGQDRTFVRYDLAADSQAVDLTLLVFCSYRDFHSETRGANGLEFDVELLKGGFRLAAGKADRKYSVYTLPEATFTELGVWYWNFYQRVEAERGLETTEDLYLPGLLRARLQPGQSLTLVAELESAEESPTNIHQSLERTRQRQIELSGGGRDEFEKQLFLAADQFVVARRSGRFVEGSGNEIGRDGSSTLIAGYHWFGDWGRDTMIALEGLTLATRRFPIAHRILWTFAQYISEGMLPNRFPDYGQTPEYNTVDATLWYFHALDRYCELSGESDLLRELFPTLRDVIDWHIKGTRYNIHVDSKDGLLFAGEPGVQLTWMDAKVGDWVVTPRIGKPIEVNALWYNAICLMRDWAEQLGEDGSLYQAMADRANESFDRFWNHEKGYLFDVIDGPDGNDSSLRPNQIFALRFKHSAVSPSHARMVMNTISEELLTPYGLRTLSPSDPNYRGRHIGNRASRDTAYHNGTVWPWLMGAYLDAHRRFFPESRDRAELFSAFSAHLSDAGLGTISECFDGDRPHKPSGCIAQAWSVAEILRARCALVSD